jgi:hypothetical protein
MVLRQVVLACIDCCASIIRTEPLFCRGKSPLSVITLSARSLGCDSDISTAPSAAIFCGSLRAAAPHRRRVGARVPTALTALLTASDVARPVCGVALSFRT